MIDIKVVEEIIKSLDKISGSLHALHKRVLELEKNKEEKI